MHTTTATLPIRSAKDGVPPAILTLKELCTRLGLSQAQLSRELAVSIDTVRACTSGRRPLSVALAAAAMEHLPVWGVIDPITAELGFVMID